MSFIRTGMIIMQICKIEELKSMGHKILRNTCPGPAARPAPPLPLLRRRRPNTVMNSMAINKSEREIN